ncbi:histidine kinase [Salipaludibacillus sp. HK11]|uniref:sensor histidine kinase n=1 Tax=Salipaludibacillus sp. HK11 TaxID=3394320 RepID=UPI0039FD8A26
MTNQETNPDKKKQSSLQGIVWDLLRLQIKVSVTAGIVSFVTLYILQNIVSIPIDASTESFFHRILVLVSDPAIYAVLTLFFTIVFLVTAWIYAYSYGISLKKTIAQIIYQLKQFQRGSLNRKITIQRKDELKKLADELNLLTDDLEQQIVSMRRVLNENATLIDEAEKGASLEERRKLARDLHDAVSQELFAVSMALAAIPKVVHSDPQKAEKLFNQIEKMVHHAQQELRALIMHLRPVTLEGKSLKQAMVSLMGELKNKHPNLEFQCDLKAIPFIEKGVEEQLFRVLQEGLSNALRHASPQLIGLQAHLREERLLVVLEDDGIGFDSANIEQNKTGNYGLTSMKERMMELGGHFTIISYPEKGTRLEFRIPLTNNNLKAEGDINE